MTDRPMWYILDGDTPVPVENMNDPRYRELWNNPDARRIDGTYLDRQGHILPLGPDAHKSPEGKYAWVSTVFLSLDHSFSFEKDATPVLFETMVFADDFDGEIQVRYHTVAEAREGHQKMVSQVQAWLVEHNSLNDFDDFEE